MLTFLSICLSPQYWDDSVCRHTRLGLFHLLVCGDPFYKHSLQGVSGLREQGLDMASCLKTSPNLLGQKSPSQLGVEDQA